MIDVPLTIYTDATADSAITALTSTRLWMERTTPETGYKPTDGPGLALAIRGGTTEYIGINLRTSLQVKCYAEDRPTAQSLYMAVFDRYHIVSSEFARPPILYSESETIGQTLEEPDTEWVFVLGFFSLVIRNT